MTKELKRELGRYRRKFGLQERTPCTAEENKRYLELISQGGELPDGVERYKVVGGDYLDEFYTLHDTDLSKEEQQEFLRLRELELLGESRDYLRTIKSCVVFFTVLTVIGLIICFLWGFFAALM